MTIEFDHFTVTDETGDYDRIFAAYRADADKTGDQWAVDAEDAASMWAAWVDEQEAESPDKRICIVVDSTEPDVRHRFRVEAETVREYSASRVSR